MTDRRDVPQDDDTQPIDSSFFSPAPQPKAEWASASWTAPPAHPTTPEHWFEPAARPATAPVQAKPVDRSNGTGVGTILAACFLSAALASGGTFAALSATGAFDAPTAPVSNADPRSEGSGPQAYCPRPRQAWRPSHARLRNPSNRLWRSILRRCDQVVYGIRIKLFLQCAFYI
jgi:hypothetical protein